MNLGAGNEQVFAEVALIQVLGRLTTGGIRPLSRRSQATPCSCPRSSTCAAPAFSWSPRRHLTEVVSPVAPVCSDPVTLTE